MLWLFNLMTVRANRSQKDDNNDNNNVHTSSSFVSSFLPLSIGKPLPNSFECMSAPYSTTTSSSMLLTNLQNSRSTSSVGTIYADKHKGHGGSGLTEVSTGAGDTLALMVQAVDESTFSLRRHRHKTTALKSTRNQARVSTKCRTNSNASTGRDDARLDINEELAELKRKMLRLTTRTKDHQ
ncbi:hypothetical protein EYF80_014899 [Liparis tanakae]|uniref:Uncharacterized protein n=1 Tax=Liparis tanakae TaxID=230148 RepID=A0A4Z2I9N2_9TELE|nr:hypothetical protein EYF80_014899 [Liparis tanakae]